ncbi:uncharacterized protein LACBIDRAFT_307255 [Laccaria bicolor S238N-H82]|uniref:Predicted protein n=1 Tax=Laccaria bicolor (strain S238N-H82 / ATCC MYA-4686) TaxID=486041 RepID=B0DPR6_LACBS|nr:uncharacterized protein LACBIDRAFT_307255 [Laccaria bicolor S238N-H82]EDR03498.1 predicted protein [Laccaria bicolor S238N-H82]|eukprot:XP_001885954.1 predicted protein [Laccaria bicolor S238N-H82]
MSHTAIRNGNNTPVEGSLADPLSPTHNLRGHGRPHHHGHHSHRQAHHTHHQPHHHHHQARHPAPHCHSRGQTHSHVQHGQHDQLRGCHALSNVHGHPRAHHQPHSHIHHMHPHRHGGDHRSRLSGLSSSHRENTSVVVQP